MKRTVFTGAEIKAWFQSSWEPGSFLDYDSWEVNGSIIVDRFDLRALKDDDKVKILSGVICNAGGYEGDAVKELRKWLAGRESNRFMIEVPQGQQEAFRAFLSGFPEAKIRA